MGSGLWEIEMSQTAVCSGWKLETNLSIDTLDSMFGHRRLMWLFEFIFIVDSMTLVVVTFLFSFISFAAASCCRGR
jgi:hypothetical protein